MVPYTAVRDLLHEYFPESENKTSRACQRRLNYMLKNQSTADNVALFLEDVKQVILASHWPQYFSRLASHWPQYVSRLASHWSMQDTEIVRQFSIPEPGAISKVNTLIGQ